jgi:hypothetical protein
MMTTAAVEAPQSIPDSPYRGIESFRYADQAIFFAREAEAQKLLRYVTIYRGVLLYGDSGSGKSSLVNAGFIPLALEEGFTPDRLRVQPVPGEEIIVERIAIDPEAKSGYLASNFVGAGESGSRIVLSAVELRERLNGLPPGQRPLLIFDQFEEFATLFEEVPRGETLKQAQSAQESILNILVGLLRDDLLPVKLLLVFREDYLAKLSKLFSRSPDLLDHHLRITPPSTDALNQIIRGSFEKFPGHFKRELPEDLTRDLTAALEARSDSNRLNLSEVQIVCLKLWQSDNPQALFHEKGVQGVLEEYLSESLDRLPEPLRDPALCLLGRLVTTSGTRNIVSEYDLITQVNEDENIPQDRLQDTLKALVEQTKLVRRERRRDVYFYDIVSEFLVPWISRKKLERRNEITRRDLEKAESLKRHRAYRISGLIILLTLLVGLSIWLYAHYELETRTKDAIVNEQVQAAYKIRDKALEREKEAATARVQAEAAQAQATQALAVALDEKSKTDQELQKVKTQAEKDKADFNSQLSKATEDAKAARADLAGVMKELANTKKDLESAKQEVEYQKTEKDKAERDGLRWRGQFLDLEKKCAPLMKRQAQ